MLPRAHLLREALDVLLEAAPCDVDVEEVRSHMLGVDGVVGVHDLHSWTITSGLPVLAAHVVVPDDALAARHGGRVLDDLCESPRRARRHSALQLEGRAHAGHESPVHDRVGQ